MIEKLEMSIKGTKNKICLISSYKFTSKKINKKIIEIIDNKIEPNIICLTGWEKILFSVKGNNANPIKDNKGSLKNNQIKI